MDSKILSILAFLSVAIAVSHAALPSEEYWNSVLPNTAMPKVVKDLLNPTSEWLEDKGTSVDVGKGGVNVNTGKPGGTSVNVGGGSGVNVNTGKPGGTSVNVGGGNGVNVNTGKPGGTSVNVGGGNGVNVNTGNKPTGTSVNVGGGGVNVNTGGSSGTSVNVGGKGGGVNVGTHNRKGKPVSVRVGAGPNPFSYLYAATETQVHDDPNVALFFLEKDLYAGNKMSLQFSKDTNEGTFLPRQVADEIPFSSNKLPEIYSKFSVQPDTEDSEAIKKTIQECEDTGIKGEEKLCATSLESMIDFSTSKLGTDVEAVSTDADSTERKVYRIEAVTKKPSDKPVVVCHKQEYPYAVFYCHKTDTTVAYDVSLVGAGGSKANAVAVCHRDTAEWNPKHLAFQVLKVKPGSVPVCHYLPENHIVWVSKN